MSFHMQLNRKHDADRLVFAVSLVTGLSLADDRRIWARMLLASSEAHHLFTFTKLQ